MNYEEAQKKSPWPNFHLNATWPIKNKGYVDFLKEK